MQFRAVGRFRVIRRIEEVGKVIFESWTCGGGVVKFVGGILGVDWEREIWKTRTGQGVRESL